MGIFTSKPTKKKQDNQKITNRSVKISEKGVNDQSTIKKKPNEEQAKDTTKKEWIIPSLFGSRKLTTKKKPNEEQVKDTTKKERIIPSLFGSRKLTNR
jgi:hypothetical protein